MRAAASGDRPVHTVSNPGHARQVEDSGRASASDVPKRLRHRRAAVEQRRALDEVRVATVGR